MVSLAKSLKTGSLISIQGKILTQDGDQIEILIAEIIHKTQKAILIQWDDSNFAYYRICKTWIPISQITILTSEYQKFNNRKTIVSYIIIPEKLKLLKLNVTELDLNYPSFDIGPDPAPKDDDAYFVSYSVPKNQADEAQERDYETQEREYEEWFMDDAIKEYEKVFLPWIEKWDKELKCRKCYSVRSVDCPLEECPKHIRKKP